MNISLSPKDYEAFGRALHEANRAFCILTGDDTQPSWDDAPDWMKTATKSSIDAIIAGATPASLHDVWSKEKLDTGWVYGPVKDAKASPPTHPCLVDYSKLPVEQRAKDDVYHRVTHALLAALRWVQLQTLPHVEPALSFPEP